MNTVPFTSAPIEVTIGIDQYSFNVKENKPFHGIKDIPIGHVHVIHFQHADNSSMRYGYWFDCRMGNFYIQYDPKDGLYKMMEERDGAKFENIVHNFKERQMMVSYPKIDEDDTWYNLTEFVQMDKIRKIVRKDENQFSYVDSSMTTVQENELLKSSLQKAGSKMEAKNEDDPAHSLNYTVINFKSREAIRPGHEMEDFLDKSYYLNTVMLQGIFKNSSNYFGELQFAFLNAMFFGNYGSSLQWHAMIELICSSATVPKHMLDKLDEILYYQIKTLPEQYSDILLNERVWNICLYSSFQKNSLHNTEKIMENKYPELLGKDNEDDALIYGISDEERDDEDDEHNPTIVGGLYYQRP
ncbi:ADM_collapsed_G0001230.mRNA.1.CDS.1 [Saccharomyces cerevisiae]|nr:BBF_HP2_G0001280.mRNA.1.CDS.1 [Saccharomyces cerevisiae]CAI5231353.1 ADM_HP2_G0001240.mRNA.1.CDS.1 [Saccharomyces cerevisiae]CAI6386057.1 ADM_HP2_G0001240.mRNA.1.CDS.1 [Saccharomyces cerevisiae]CAI6387051.1 BBF_HP1_G0001240.mRNA.1.CDS.1 [Saccharomyces cerevisiae]CAI6387475.1 BBF_HP2_G0001280.mRNA.1.CDS.1 [Saccharomyces cerevisiae]